ncbi:DUF934 domain-containing protein [Aestuariibius sp. HNIBRBA575]|uniref:DUF934 domain-containing protein n=1 Tax=Aestuariibius sp. HNIBRBA575 TaxID=3233343 RepID=UPI0034A0DA23
MLLNNTQLINDTGFVPEDWTGQFYELNALPANDGAVDWAVDVPSDGDISLLAERVGDIALIRIDFPSFADGRGFTLAARLRRMGFTGRLRARGHVIADQYAMARRSGFDEVEVDGALADRQPEAQWLARANWQAHDYQNRMRA